MEVKNTFINGLKIIEPRVFEDERGHFFESYNQDQFIKAGITDTFVQDNQSFSKKGVLRGLHFQVGNHAQAKIVRVLKGSVIDIAVDLRKNSATFGQHFSIELNDRNKLVFYIPVGFAHGFVALEEDTVFSYKCSALYNKEAEGGIIWNDSTLSINWAYPNPLVSEKDAILPPFNPDKAFF